MRFEVYPLRPSGFHGCSAFLASVVFAFFVGGCQAAPPLSGPDVREGGNPPAALVEEYGIELPAEARETRYREIRMTGGGSLYVVAKLDRTRAIAWLESLGGDPAELVEGWDPFIPDEREDAGWGPMEKSRMEGINLPVSSVKPFTDKGIAFVDESGGAVRVYIAADL